MNDEEWLPVRGYEGLYEVSSLGRVRSLDRVVCLKNEHGRIYQRRRFTGQILRQQPHSGADYPQVKLSKAGIIKNRFVHVLVCEAFLGPRPDGMQAAHFDGDRQNPRLNNMRWATRSENEADKIRHGRRRQGEAAHNAILTAAAVREIRRRVKNGERQNALAREFRINKATLWNLLNGRTWKSVQ